MTTTADHPVRAQRPDGAARTDPHAASNTARARAQRRVPSGARQAAVALGLASLLAVGFAGYLFGLSGLSERRAQNVMLKSLRYALAQAVAPVGPSTPGTPMAVLDIPAIGVHHVVVVEGTSARNLTRGPGHRRDTPMPGQAGVSVIYGRRATFGAPFEHLLRLRVGDRVTVTTGQGASNYLVSSFGDRRHPAPANSDNRLVLTTAESATSPRGSTVSVSADLASAVQPSGGALPTISADESGMHGDPTGSLLPSLLWSQALLLLAVIGTVARHRWSRWPAWLCIVPAFEAVLWSLYENAATLLPNLF